MGGPGLAFIYVREDLIPSLQPTIAGWFGNRDQLKLRPWEFTYREDAARMELGTPAIACVSAAAAALGLALEVGVERIRERTAALTSALIEHALAHGWKVRTGNDHPTRRSAIVSIDLGLPEPAGSALANRLKEERHIIVDSRATPVRDATAPRTAVVRIAPHYYNTDAEIETVVRAIAEMLPR
jgi:kynureninase